MSGYIGWTGFDGASMPEADEYRVFDSAAEVWAALYADMETFGWSHVPDNEDDGPFPFDRF